VASRVFLHIGLPKTGTTFLQTTMWANRTQLRGQGVLYPGTDRFDHFHAFQQVRGADKRRGGVHAGGWDRLAHELRAWDGAGLVSHEFFCMATRQQARRVVADLQPAEVHVVVTARAYALQFPAIWQEALKMGYDGGFDQFMEETFAGKRLGAWGWSSQNLPAILGTWSKLVPPERIHVVTVPPPGARRGLLWERWCQTLGIDDAGFDLDLSYPNESLGAQQAALLRRVKPFLSGPLLDGPTRHRWVRRYFGHEVLVPQAGPRFSPSPEYAEELRRRSRGAISSIRRGGYDVVGSLADLAAESPAVDGLHPDHVSAEEMLEVAARAIEQMIRDMREMTLQRNRWRHGAMAVSKRSRIGRVRSRIGKVRRLARRLRGGGRP
jgi:hypothetical protein